MNKVEKQSAKSDWRRSWQFHLATLGYSEVIKIQVVETKQFQLLCNFAPLENANIIYYPKSIVII